MAHGRPDRVTTGSIPPTPTSVEGGRVDDPVTRRVLRDDDGVDGPTFRSYDYHIGSRVVVGRYEPDGP